MALHLNDWALRERGWNMVAAYECFEKGQRCLNIECWENHGAYLVRSWFSHGRLWDDVFHDRDAANKEVKRLWSLRKWHKKVA